MASLNTLLKHAVPESLKQDLKRAVGVPSVESALKRMKRIGFRPGVAIDVGAYSGEWTRSFKKIFPDARVLMIEPQEQLQSQLDQTVAQLQGVSCRQVLLGASEQDQVNFYQRETASSILPETDKTEEPSIQLSLTTLDAVSVDAAFAKTDFIKLDVQGFELEVLKGGERTLANVEALLMEVNLIEIYKGAPLFAEVVGFMAQRGFQIYDVCSFFRRPLDEALWQMDVIFVRTTSCLVSSRRWE
jgi:FkbM family methyltransferase